MIKFYNNLVIVLLFIWRAAAAVRLQLRAQGLQWWAKGVGWGAAAAVRVHLRAQGRQWWAKEGFSGGQRGRLLPKPPVCPLTLRLMPSIGRKGAMHS
jgi:hypothetical protein